MVVTGRERFHITGNLGWCGHYIFFQTVEINALKHVNTFVKLIRPFYPSIHPPSGLTYKKQRQKVNRHFMSTLCKKEILFHRNTKKYHLDANCVFAKASTSGQMIGRCHTSPHWVKTVHTVSRPMVDKLTDTIVKCGLDCEGLQTD